MKCRFCELIEDPKKCFPIFESENIFAFLEKFPMNEGHLLVVPKNHVPDFEELPEKEYSELMRVCKNLSKVLKKEFKCKKVGMFIIGFDISHTHVHLIPLHEQYSLDSTGKRTSSKNKLSTETNLEAAQNRILANF